VKSVKKRMAAIAAIVGLGGLAGVALSAGGQRADPLATKPLVRTEVIHRTIRVTKHVKPKHPVAAGGGGYAGSSVATGSEAPGPTTASSGTGEEAAPVTTATSGTGNAYGGGEGEHESEGGGDD